MNENRYFPDPCPWCGKRVAAPLGGQSLRACKPLYTDGTRAKVYGMHRACRRAYLSGKPRPLSALGPAVPFVIEKEE